MDIEFKDVKELYNKVSPALNVKRRMLQKKGINLNNKELFEYLIKNIWSKKSGLALNDIVDDIINVDIKSI